MHLAKRHSRLLTGLALFVVALLPRALNLGAFATADEAKWVYRSAQFLAALLDGNLAGTMVNLTPAVTTTWLGSLGLAAFHSLRSLRGGAPGLALGEWLRSLPEFRAEVDVLLAVRWPMVLLGALGVVGLYLLARRLVGQRAALVFGLLLALDPHLISLSRLLGHDAPAALFVGLSLLAFLVALQRAAEGVRPGSPATRRIASALARDYCPLAKRRSARHYAGDYCWMAFSGALAGLAMLSKSPAFFLVPFVGLGSLVASFRAPAGLGIGWDRGATDRVVHRLAGVLIWGVAAWIVFVALWPAAWQNPLGAPYAVVHNAFLSASDRVEAEAEGYWQVPDLGVLYYPVNAAFKLAPVAALGLAVWLWSAMTRRRRNIIAPLAAPAEAPIDGDRRSEWMLFAFAVLFVLFMTLGGKRSNRYLLPAWPALYLLAALGLTRLAAVLPALRVGRPARFAIGALMIILMLLPAGATYPYYLTYTNPLVGGALSAPHLVKIGWGEGLDQAGRWLQSQPDAQALRVGSYYPSALSPFYGGRISGVTAGQLDYVVLYVKQTQEGDPSPAFLTYFRAAAPLYSVHLAGIEYARVYAGPSLQPAMANEAAFDIGILPKPLFFRPGRPYLPIGAPVTVEVLWLSEEQLPAEPSRMTLQPAADLTVRPEQRSGHAWAEAEAPLQRRADGLVVSRHTLALPPDLPRGSYGLLVDGRPLGTVDARQFKAPPLDFRLDAVFGDQIRLLGLVGDRAVGADSSIELVWQAAPRAWADYTVFMHLLDGDGHRLAGLDVQPPVPATQWARGEVVRMTYAPGGAYALPIATDLPPGDYRLAVGLYDPASGVRLPVRDATGSALGDQVILPLSVATAGAGTANP